jgi:hypothetical protein
MLVMHIFVIINRSTGNSRLSGAMEGRKVMDNPKSQLKQKHSKHGTKWI